MGRRNGHEMTAGGRFFAWATALGVVGLGAYKLVPSQPIHRDSDGKTTVGIDLFNHYYGNGACQAVLQNRDNQRARTTERITGVIQSIVHDCGVCIDSIPALRIEGIPQQFIICADDAPGAIQLTQDQSSGVIYAEGHLTTKPGESPPGTVQDFLTSRADQCKGWMAHDINEKLDGYMDRVFKDNDVASAINARIMVAAGVTTPCDVLLSAAGATTTTRLP